MFGTNNFLRYFIGSFLTLIFIMNIIYAFSLVDSLGLPFVYQGDIDDYSNRFFGVNQLIQLFKDFFQNNDFLNDTRELLSKWYGFMKVVSIKNVYDKWTDSWGLNDVAWNWNAILSSIVVNTIKGFGTLFDIFVNVPYIFMILVYFFMFLFYVLAIIFSFISFACYVLSGLAAGFMPNTQFPSLEDIENGGWASTILQLQFFLH